MQESTSKEKILKKIRNALIFKDNESFPDVDLESPVHITSDESPEIRFAQNFTELTGKFAFVEDEKELASLLVQILGENGITEVFALEKPITDLLHRNEVPFSSDLSVLTKHKLAITLCECLIARTGSVVISSGQDAGRRLHAYPDIHVVIAEASQVVSDIKDGLQLVRNKYGTQLPGLISVVSGPSRTADIEKTLVLGAHGPKEIIVFLMDKIPN